MQKLYASDGCSGAPQQCQVPRAHWQDKEEGRCSFRRQLQQQQEAPQQRVEASSSRRGWERRAFSSLIRRHQPFRMQR
jgi:hypothetical protein